VLLSEFEQQPQFFSLVLILLLTTCLALVERYLNETCISRIYNCITSTHVYALIVPVFFEMDIAFGEGENFVDDIDIEK
jgi:hypothetical protein